ncbi:MAG: CYTH domain-containing protein [Candidatus Hydrogenedentales bacterium]
MGTEIERKFLVATDAWRETASEGVPILQGYIAMGPPIAVRVRIAAEQATLNLKKSTVDIARDEFEYPIPADDAAQLLGHFCAGHVIQKKRHTVEYRGFIWEVDTFEGSNEGLVVAEIELTAVDQPFDLPPWVGNEVSGDPRYLNTSLSVHPYRDW